MQSGNPAPTNEFLTLDSDRIHPATCGNKAARLAQLRRRGLPVLAGAVWGGSEIPSEADLLRLERTLPLPWILRSSAASEDGNLTSLAGCHLSVGPVSGIPEALEAFGRIRRTTDAARTLGAISGVWIGPPAVLFQPHRTFAFTGVALWPHPGDEATLRIEGASGGRVVDGDAPEALPGALTDRVRQLVLQTLPELPVGGLDLEWGALPDDQGWELTLLQARPLLPTAQDPPTYMSSGVWIHNTHHHPHVLSVFYASVVEATRDRLGLPQGAWLGRLYERQDRDPLPGFDAGIQELAAGPLLDQRHRLQVQVDRFLRFVRSYLTRRRPVRPGANCVAALLTAAPRDCVLKRDRWFDFCEIFPAFWDPQAPSIADGLERLRVVCQVKPDPARTETVRIGPGDTPWRVFARSVDSREQDDWVFARMLRTLRIAVLDWGDAATTAGWIATPQDAFLLTLPELLAGRPPAPALPGLRRQLLRAQESFSAPERVVDGVPRWSQARQSTSAGEPASATELQGEGAVPGRAGGIVGPLPVPGEAAAGRIAVVHALTPQDIVLLPGVAGLIVERPGTCGHAVLIARELGIPTVTGVPGCIHRIPAGSQVWIDGTLGRVRWHQPT
ncbi:hypothetical protein KJ975_11545 [Myxococcota bacterium]|nr:hypothetical protein [Myxococcota bacterium]